MEHLSKARCQVSPISSIPIPIPISISITITITIATITSVSICISTCHLHLRLNHHLPFFPYRDVILNLRLLSFSNVSLTPMSIPTAEKAILDLRSIHTGKQFPSVHVHVHPHLPTRLDLWQHHDGDTKSHDYSEHLCFGHGIVHECVCGDVND